MGKRTLILMVTVVALLAATQVGASAGHSWSGYHYDDHDGTAELAVVDDLTKYATEFSDVIADWNGPAGPLALSVTDGTARPAACDNVGTEEAGMKISGEIHVCNAEYTKNGWLGLARIWLTADGHIESAVTLMNDSYLQTGTYNNAVVWRHVLCQEIGHDVGLGHVGSPRKASCMNDRWGLDNESFQSPNAHDYEQLNEIYGGASTDGGGNDKPCRGKSGKCGFGTGPSRVDARPGGGVILTFTFDVPSGR